MSGIHRFAPALVIGALAGCTGGPVSRAGMPPEVPVSQANYVCDQHRSMTAEYYRSSTPPGAAGPTPRPAGSVALRLDGGPLLRLPQTLSADGARYAHDGLVFWSRGNGAFVSRRGRRIYAGCVWVAPDPGDLPGVYHGDDPGLTLRYPRDARIDPGYRYQGFGPGRAIAGVSFRVPAHFAKGTNLGADSYFSVEWLRGRQRCDATAFLSAPVTAKTQYLGGREYSVAQSTGAGVGNRYLERVYALAGSRPCTALRYFIHSSVLQNYPPGAVQAFDRPALLRLFDQMRDSLRLAP